jgi:uncharacterized protein (TIGR03437 family)
MPGILKTARFTPNAGGKLGNRRAPRNAMLPRLLLCLAGLVLLSATAAIAAQPGFLLGADYSEWAPPATSAIATDSSGALYLLSNSCQVTGAPISSCVTKLSADGKTILWQNTLGFPIGYDATAMAVDPNGGVYVIPEYAPPDLNVYVAKLGANGAGIAWKTAVAVNLANPSISSDSLGRTYVAGAIGPAVATSAIIRLNAAGSAVDYTAQVTGYVTSVAADETGAAFVTGNATVPFLARIAPDGAVEFNTPLSSLGSAGAVAVDPNGNAVVCGKSASGSIVVLRFNSAGAVTLSSAVGSSTATLGGGYNFVLDAAGNAYVTGSSYIFDAGAPYLLPVRNSLATCGSEWVSVIAPGGSVLQTTYIPPGGETLVEAPFIATGPNSTVFVVHSPGTSFAPTQSGPFAPGTAGAGLVPYFLWHLSPHADAQTFPLACLGNAATYQTGPIAPGGFVTLFGSGLGPQQGVQPQATLQSPFPTQTAGVKVTFDGTPAPLLWVQDAQINVVAPWSLTPGQTTQVCVTYNAVMTNCLTWPVVQTAPAVFTWDGVHAVALNQDTTVNSANNPAALGSVVSVFATGLGPITPPQADGTLVGLPLPKNVLGIGVGFTVENPPFGATIFNPFDVTYGGPAPYLVAGASQINFKLGPPANQNDLYTYTGQQNINLFLPSTLSQAFAVYVAGQ